MKENRSWTASLQEMKHGFMSSSQSQKETPGFGNILIHHTTEKFRIEPSAKKTMVIMFWDCEGLLLCEFLPPKKKNQQRQILQNSQKIEQGH
jgi:hypothetical protein